MPLCYLPSEKTARIMLEKNDRQGELSLAPHLLYVPYARLTFRSYFVISFLTMGRSLCIELNTPKQKHI